jgi:TP901 family phage tail tape measure protein
MAVQISVQASQTALAQSIAQGVAAFNARYASQNQLNLQINAGSFTQPLGRITGNLKEFESALAASNARVLAFGASTAVIGGVGKAFREIADVTIEVEKNITDINRVLGLSTDKLQKFSSDLFGVAKLTASSFQDAAKASLEFSRQGLNAEDTLKKTADAMTLVRLTGVSAAQAVEDLTAATNAFKETGLTTNDILNKIVAVEQQFAVSADDLTSAVSRTGQAAKEAGVNFDQLNALVASAQEKTARGGAVIGNALKTIFTRLQRTETLDQLENFNIAVRDIEGNVLPAIQILQNFAGAYKDLSTAQKASLSEQVAGVYQVNILKSIITDLNDKQGVYNKALDYGTQATNEAEQANAKLNLTLAALISQTGTNLQQLSNNIGKVTFEPVFKSLVSPFNDAVTYINDLLEGEGIGSQFANGLLLGIKNILSGPGLVGAVAVIGKVITNTFSYASSALPALFGITTETQKRKNIEEAVLKIIQSQSQVSLALRGQQGNLVAQSQTLFNLAQAQTAEYQQQLATAKQLAAALTPRNITVGQAGLQVGKIKAGGYIPRDVQNAEVMGAAIGGYKAGKVINAPVGGVMNSAEKVKYIPGFAQPFINPPAGSKAGRMHRIKSINQTGVDPYTAASGFVPNFAKLDERDYSFESPSGGRVDKLQRANGNYAIQITQVSPASLGAEKDLDLIGGNLDAGFDNKTKKSNFIYDWISGKIDVRKFLNKENVDSAMSDIWLGLLKNDKGLIKKGQNIGLTNNDLARVVNTSKSKVGFTIAELKQKYQLSLNEEAAKNNTFFTYKSGSKKGQLITTSEGFQNSLNGDYQNFVGDAYEKLISKLPGVSGAYVISKNATSAADLIPNPSIMGPHAIQGIESKAGQAYLSQLIKKAIRINIRGRAEDVAQKDLNFGTLPVYQPFGSEIQTSSNGFIPNFATGLSPKVTRLPWLKSFANKEWFNRFPWFNDIDLKNTSQNMDYNPYTGERKLIPGSEMFRELNFLTHGNNKNITTGNSPLFSYLYEEYVRDILNEVTKNKSIKDAEEAGFPMRDKYGNPTKFDPFKAANTAPMDALIRNRAGRIGGIEIKGGTEENWKTKDILKKEQDFETQNPGSTLGRRTRVYSNMYKGTDFLTKGLLKRLGVDKAKTITNKLISFYADKIAGHESEIENNWRTNKGLSNGFIPNFVKKAQSIPPRSKSTEPYRRGTNWWWETKKGYISAIQKAKNTYEIEGIEVYDKYKGQGESTKFYKGIAEKIGPGNNITGVLLPQEQALADYASGKPVPAKAIFPQLAWAKTAKSSKLLVNGKEMAISDFEKGIANHKYNASKLEMALIELINSHASGFIPNFAYQQAVMSLEESMSGNKAILDTTTGPFPFVRNSSQPNFASAVADHGGVQNALKDSMAGQKAAGLMANGNIPNFAAPNPITLTGKAYAGNAAIEQTINKYLKSIDILTIKNNQIGSDLDSLKSSLGLSNTAFKKLKAEVIAHADAERVAATTVPLGPPVPSRQGGPLAGTPYNQYGGAPVPSLPGRGTFGRNLQAGTLRATRGSSRFFGGLGSNLAFTLGAPLIAGQLESAITQGRDRSELSASQRFAGSAASSVLTNVSTGAALGTALAPILGPLAPFGPLIGVAGGALTGLASAAMGASDNLEDLQKKSETYRNETQSAIESGKGIIDTIKALGNLDPNSLEAFDANQKLEEYFTKISETGLDEKFKEAGNDIEKMTQAIKDYEMERVAGAKRATEAVNRKAKTDLSIEDLAKKRILRTEAAGTTKFKTARGGGLVSYKTSEEEIATTGAAGQANFEKLASQNSQLFEDLSKIQKGVGEDFTDFVKVVQEEFNSFEFNQDTVKGFLKKYNIEGVDVKEFAATLEAINEENGKYGKTLSTNLFDIFKSIQENRTKTAADKAAKAQEIAQRVEGVRQALFRYSQAIEQAIANTAMQIENYDFEKSFGKLNLEKSSQLINDGLAAISKNIDNAFKNQFDLLIGETANIQQKRMLDFDAANFEKGFALQKESRTLNRSKELINVLQGALEETAAGNIDQIVEEFQRTGTVDVSNISGLKKGAESRRAVESFNLTTSLEEKAARNKDENARKIFMAEQAYANKSLELKNAVGKLDYDLSERRYKNTLREKELVDNITNQNKQIQIKGQAEIERRRIETESPYFMLGRGEFAISDEKRAREAQNTQKGFELEARQAIADAEIARIQREVFADNTDATLQNTTAIEDLIMAMTQQGNAAFNAQQDVIKNIDSQIEAKQRKLTYDFEPGDTQGSMELQKEINDLKAEKENIIGSKEYVSNKASADLRNRQIEMQVARQELQNRRTKGGSFGSMDLSSIKDPVNYLKERASEERKVLQTLEDQKESLIIQSEEGNLTLEQSQKLKTLDEQIAKQRSVVNDVDNANLSIQEKITTEKTRQNQLDKDREKRGKFGTGVSKALGDIRTEIDTFEERLGGTTVTAFRDGLVGAMDAAINKTDDLGSALLEVAGGFLKSIQNAMFQQIANQIVSGAGFAIGKQKGGVIHAQAGMYISDGGRTGDVNPAMLEDGEYVLNRKTVKALGGPKEIDKLNFGMFPRFGGPTRRFADGGNTGSIQAAASMNEPFAQLSEFGKENNPEYQKYLERIREEQAKKDAKKAQKDALIRSLIGTALTTGIMMGVGSLAKSMGQPKVQGKAVSGSAYGNTVAGKLESQASLFGSPEDMVIKRQKGGVMHFANGGYLPYGNRLNDSIPALLSGGEYIVNSKAVRKYGVGGLNRINSGVARFQDGGLVGDVAKTNANTESSTSNNVSVNITVNATDGKAQNEQSSADGGDDKNRALGNKIKEVVLQVITNEQRTGGLLDSTKKK